MPWHQSKARPIKITARQVEILHWMAEGKQLDDIGIILGISGRTVKFHLYRAMERLDCVTSAQAVARAVKTGLI